MGSGLREREAHGDALVVLGVGRDIRKRLGVPAAGDAFHFFRRHGVELHETASGIGPVGAEFPRRVVFIGAEIESLGRVAFEVNLEIVALDEPSEVLEDEVAPLGELCGVVFEEGLFRAVVNFHFQPVVGDCDLDGLFVLVVDIEEAIEIPRDGAQEALVFDMGLVVERGILARGLDFLLHDAPGGRPAFIGGILEVERGVNKDLRLEVGNPEDEEECHHGGDKVRVGDFPRSAVVFVFFLGHGD